jgi:Fe2+ or Zn2+ uptake regulation protein
VRPVDEMVDAYRASGRKVTPQRLAVMAAVHGNASHPTAESVHAIVTASMPTVSLRTVYSVLGELVQLGELHHLDLGTGSARFDPNVEAHHHLVCESCGAVRDVAVDHPDVKPVSSPDAGFSIHSTDIVFRGRCGGCSDATTSQRRDHSG